MLKRVSRTMEQRRKTEQRRDSQRAGEVWDKSHAAILTVGKGEPGGRETQTNRK